ncbi:MAG: phosphate acyltransferase PlsX [Bradymonadia bacterium]
MTTIALDAMGGDHGVAPAVKAAAHLSMQSGTGVLLVGDEGQISAELRRQKYDPASLSIHHTSQWVTMEDSPKTVFDKKPDASVLVGTALVAAGEADALVSAGNTGAGIMACVRNFNQLKGVPRTALATVYPTEQRRGELSDPFSLILDVGATLHASADALVGFAHMGSAYAACISRNPRPRVALLSNGSEAHKGPPEVVEAHRRLSQSTHIHFIGNIEGVDVPRGVADVVVTSGFTGNVVLKMLEGISETVMDIARYAYRNKLTWKLGMMMLQGGITQLKQATDWRQYGGAPILGFDKLFIKAHGRSNWRAIANALKVARKAVEADLCSTIEAQLADQLAKATPDPLDVSSLEEPPA